MKRGNFILKKVSIFFALYAIAAVVMEGIILLLFLALGYDALHGVLPETALATLVSLYGFAGFFGLTWCYMKKYEKDSSLTAGSRWEEGRKAVVFFLAGAIMVGVVLMILVLGGMYRFAGFRYESLPMVLAMLFAYVIQASAEELMCRGFLLNVLRMRISCAGAIFISTVCFMLPHLPTIVEMGGVMAVVAVLNLGIVSVLFSIVMLREHSVWAACGLHAGWNFMLGTICGLEVSGSGNSSGILLFQQQNKWTVLTGGDYGIEASLLLVPVLLLIIVVYGKGKRRMANVV